MKRIKSVFGGGLAAFFFVLAVTSFAFAAGNQAGDIDQWANSDNQWQNGDLNPSNSHYREDYTVPYRAKLTGLIIGHSYTIPIEYDSTKSGMHAIDYLQTYNVTENPDPCSGGVCPAGSPTTFPIPIDPNVNNASGPHPLLNYLPSDPRFQFVMWGGAVTAAGPYAVSQGTYTGGVYSGDSSTMLYVTFTASSTSALLAWGGHISTHSDWGVGSTAVNISGSPYHMRLGSAINNNFRDNTANDNSTLGNQDRSMKVSTFSSRITVKKVGDPVDSNALFGFTMTGGKCAGSFSLPADGSIRTCNRIETAGSFTITEILGASNYAWALTNIQCTSIGTPPVSTFNINPALPLNAPNSGSVTFSIDPLLQQDVSCTFTNKHKPTLTVTKVVQNNFGGSAVASDFNFHVNGTHVLDANGNPISNSDIVKSGTTLILDGGSSFSVTEDSHPGYGMTSQNGCTGTATFNDQKTCTITNHDIQPQLTVIKHVVNNNGGTLNANNFTMFVTGTNVSNASFAGAEAGVTVTLNQGTYSVVETGSPNYTALYLNCNGSIFVGDHLTCTITNDDIGPKVKVIKNAIGGNATFPINITWSNGSASPSITTAGGSGGDPYAQTPVAPTPGTGDTGYLEVGSGSVTVAEDLSGLQTPPGWRFTSVSCQEDLQTPSPIAVSQGTSVTLNGLQLGHSYSCTFTNTQDALIPLTKKVNGNAPACDSNTHVCTDSVSGQTIPTFTLAQFPQGTYPPASPLASVTGPPFQNLSGAGSYTICETGLPAAGWNLSTGDVTVLVSMFGGAASTLTPGVSNHDTSNPDTVNRCFDITIPAGADSLAITVNNKAEGKLKIVKQAQGGDDTFSFNISAGPSSLGPVSITTSGGSGSSSDMTALIGNYTITENSLPSGWALKDLTCSGPTGATVSSNLGASQITAKVVPGTTTTCTITNTKYGHLVVHKVTAPSTDTTTQFSIVATGNNSITAPASRTIVGGGSTDYQVLAGTYTVTETVPAGWDKTDTCQNVPVAAGQTVDCTITNTKRGHLIVQKTTHPSGDTTVFSINASGNGSITGGGAGTVTDATDNDYEVTPGTYSVTETVPAGWDMNSNACASVAVGPGETKTCEIVNTKRGHLIVQKTTHPSGDTTVFSVSATGSGAITGGGAATVTDATDHDYEVVPGTYSVTETVPAGWDMNSNACTSVAVGPGETKTCEIVNTKRGHLIVQKTTFPSGDTTVFSVNATGSGAITGGGAATVTDATDHDYEVVPGTYSVTETVPAGWDMNSNACSGVVVGPGETKTCEIVNTKRGHIIVQKTTFPAADPTVFSVNATGTGTVTSGAAGTVTDATDHNYEVIPGTYSVTETVPAGWDMNSNACSGVVVGPGETKTCEIVNTKRGHIIVQKTTFPAADPTVFSINATGTGTVTSGAAGTVTDAIDHNYEVIPGTYSVTETVPAGWDMNSNACSGVVVGPGETKTCEIVNTKRGHIIVQKTTFPSGDPTVFSVNATGTGTVTSGASATVTDAVDHNYEVIPGTYSVAETVPAGWDMNSNACTNVVVGPGETKTCEIVNTKRGHIVVQKTTFPSGDPTSFTVNASGTGTVTSGASATVTDAIDHDYEVVPGTYSVAETVPAGWDMNSNACTNVVVGPGETKTCEIVNTKRGHIVVQKTTFPSGDPTVFSVNATGTGTVTSGASATVTDAIDHDYEVVPGTYSVAETVPAGWDMNSNACTNVVVGPGETKTCEIVNTKRGHIIVQKTTNPGGDPTVFTVNATGTGTVTGGPTATVTDAIDHNYEVVPGTYSVAETVPAGWDMNSNACTGVVVGPGETKTCEIVNTKRGHIIVQKTTNPGGDPTVFTVNATGTGTVSGGGAGTVTDAIDHDYEVTPGTYGVAESPTAGWDMNSNSCSGIVVGPGETKTCEIVNTKRGHIIVQKTTNPAGDPAVFNITASGSGSITGGGAGTVTDAIDQNYEVTPGTYGVAESATAGWDMSSNSCSGIVVGPGETKTCEIVNIKRGHIIVQKTTNPAGDPTVFNLTASGSGSVTGGGAGTVTDAIDQNYEVTPGTYGVAESPAAGWDMNSNSCSSIVVGPGETKTCEIVNTKRGHFVVHKVTDPANDPTVFSLLASGSGSITGGGAGSVSTSSPMNYEVTPGTYSALETVPAGWDKTNDSCQGVVVGAGQTVDCTITNVKRGHLVVHKTTSPAGDPTVFSIQAGGSGTITGGGAGSISSSSTQNYEVTPGTYSVAETPTAGWDKTSDTCQGVVVPAGQTVDCTITNIKKGHLIVTKATLPPTDTTTQFPVTASGSGAITGPAGRTLTGNGSSTDYEVQGDQSYSVAETVPTGWTQTGNTCQNVSVPAGQTVNCQITNNALGHVVVTKIVVNDNGGTANPSNFTMNVAAGYASPASFPGGSGTTVDVMAGSYSVTESGGPSGYAATFSADCTGTVAPGEIKTCTVTNDDIQPKVIVTKVVVNDNGGTAIPSNFTINAAGNLATPASFLGGSGTPVLLNAGAYSITEGTAVGYAASYSAGCSGTVAVGDVKFCTITNDDIQPKLIVIKQVVNNNGGTKTPGDFTFNVSGISASPSTFAGSAGTQVLLNAGAYSVSEVNALGYQASYSATCSGTINVGETKTCMVTNNDYPLGQVTSSELCRFSVPGLDQFQLNYKKDTGSNSTLNASNPGQFYYNLVNTTGATQVITMKIPFPFVTQGSTPVHVYAPGSWSWDDAGQCFRPSGGGAGQNSLITLNNYSGNTIGAANYTTVVVTVPSGGYANIHLDYGFKGTSQWQNNSGDAKKGPTTILNNQPYTFGDSLSGNHGATSGNKFN